MITQVFIIGSSLVYGVGAEKSGWADLIKQFFHQKMYGEGGVGEQYEVFNFAKSGAKIQFAKRLFPILVKEYGRDGKIITIVSIGGNNAKAVDFPTNYVSTLEEYSAEMAELLDLLKEKSDVVIAVGGGYYDESKTNPKHNPFTGGKSFFKNERRKKFEQKFRELCSERGIVFVGVELNKEEWQQHYLYKDGLHPNQKGHSYIASNVIKVLEKEL